MGQFDVFLSHNSKDKPWVEKLKAALVEHGLKVWLDKDEIRPGDLFAKALEEGLETSKAVALIVSPEAMASGWVEEEYYRALSLAQDRQLQLIPVILQEASVPGFLKSRSWVDFRNESNFDENVKMLVWGITGKKFGNGEDSGEQSSPAEFGYEASPRFSAETVQLSFSDSAIQNKIILPHQCLEKIQWPSEDAKKEIEAILKERQGEEQLWTPGRREIETNGRWEMSPIPHGQLSYDKYFTNHLRELQKTAKHDYRFVDRYHLYEVIAHHLKIYVHNSGPAYLEDCSVKLGWQSQDGFQVNGKLGDPRNQSYSKPLPALVNADKVSSLCSVGEVKHHFPQAISDTSYRVSGTCKMKGKTAVIEGAIYAKNLSTPIQSFLEIQFR